MNSSPAGSSRLLYSEGLLCFNVLSAQQGALVAAMKAFTARKKRADLDELDKGMNIDGQ